MQIKTLQGDFEQLKSEYATLLEIHKKDIVQSKTHVSTAVQVRHSSQLRVSPNFVNIVQHLCEKRYINKMLKCIVIIIIMVVII